MEAQAAVAAQPRLRNYALLSSAYTLYDQGVNERLKGNYGLSTDKLTEAVKLIDQASSIGRDGRPSTMASMVFFELGQSAEADGDLSLARDSYVHAVKAKPDYVEAYLRLVNVLATSGKLRQALNYLNDGLREVPHDPRLNAMLTQLGGFMGDEHNTGFGNDMSQGDDDEPPAPRGQGIPPAPNGKPDTIERLHAKVGEEPEKADKQIEQADKQPDKDAKLPGKADKQSDQAETKPTPVEMQADQDDSKADPADVKADQVDMKPEQADKKPDSTEMKEPKKGAAPADPSPAKN